MPVPAENCSGDSPARGHEEREFTLRQFQAHDVSAQMNFVNRVHALRIGMHLVKRLIQCARFRRLRDVHTEASGPAYPH